MSKQGKRLEALHNFKNNNPDGNKRLAEYFLATVPYSKLKQVCEDLDIKVDYDVERKK